MDRKRVRRPLAAAVALLVLSAAFGGPGSAQGRTREAGFAATSSPSVICVPGYPRNSRVVYRRTPRVCNFLFRGAPVIHPGLVLSHATRWTTWNSSAAIGTGRHFVNSGPPNGEPMKFKLTDPVKVCGNTVFSTLQVRVRKLTYRPNAKPKYVWGRWLPWGEPYDIAVCSR